MGFQGKCMACFGELDSNGICRCCGRDSSKIERRPVLDDDGVVKMMTDAEAYSARARINRKRKAELQIEREEQRKIREAEEAQRRAEREKERQKREKERQERAAAEAALRYEERLRIAEDVKYIRNHKQEITTDILEFISYNKGTRADTYKFIIEDSRDDVTLSHDIVDEYIEATKEKNAPTGSHITAWYRNLVHTQITAIRNAFSNTVVLDILLKSFKARPRKEVESVHVVFDILAEHGRYYKGCHKVELYDINSIDSGTDIDFNTLFVAKLRVAYTDICKKTMLIAIKPNYIWNFELDKLTDTEFRVVSYLLERCLSHFRNKAKTDGKTKKVLLDSLEKEKAYEKKKLEYGLKVKETLKERLDEIESKHRPWQRALNEKRLVREQRAIGEEADAREEARKKKEQLETLEKKIDDLEKDEKGTKEKEKELVAREAHHKRVMTILEPKDRVTPDEIVETEKRYDSLLKTIRDTENLRILHDENPNESYRIKMKALATSDKVLLALIMEIFNLADARLNEKRERVRRRQKEEKAATEEARKKASRQKKAAHTDEDSDYTDGGTHYFDCEVYGLAGKYDRYSKYKRAFRVGSSLRDIEDSYKEYVDAQNFE